MKYTLTGALTLFVAVSTASADEGHLRIVLPSDVVLTVNGTQSQNQTGERLIVSQDLRPGTDYYYELVAQAYRNGQWYTERRIVSVEAGQLTKVTFNFPQEQSNVVQSNYAQGQSYYPQGQARYPQGQSYSPQGQSYSPQGQSYYPQGQSYYPQGQSYYPQGQARYPTNLQLGMTPQATFNPFANATGAQSDLGRIVDREGRRPITPPSPQPARPRR
jgi:uncharacterized protein (TIGR03000 family)